MMAGVWNLVVFISLVFIPLTVYSQNSKLNVPRVLLPIFKDFSTNFTLEVSDSGCYKWSTSRIDLIQLILPESEDAMSDCSTSVIISAISKEPTRNTAIVFAEDRRSGFILRCDVIVDVISSLIVVTTTRELYMEEAPEAFEVRAYDEQGNEFTTLEGIEFQWSLSSWNTHQDGSSSGSNVLRFITFKDSPYETPPTVQKFDGLGKQGHIVLLEGMKTGSAKVSVRLPHTEYQHVPGIEMQLMVVANLIIDPADLFLLKGDSAKYRILQVHHGRLEEIPLPSQQYYLELQESDVAEIEKETAIVTGIKKGKTKVLLHDRNVDEKEAGIRVPTATLTVTDPHYLTLGILPHRNWILMVKRHYEIVVEIYDSENHKFHIGNAVQVSVSIPEQYFRVDKSSKNNTHHYGWPVKVGTAQVSAVLEGVTDAFGKLLPSPTISAVADMFIYNQITIYPNEVALPWDPVIQPRYEVHLNASGGDGSFTWSSANKNVAVVTQTGVVKTHLFGHAEISAAMTRNHYNRKKVNVFVVPASHLEIVEYTLEAEIGVPIYIHVAVFANRPNISELQKSSNMRIPFTKCGDLPLTVKVWSNIFVNSSSKVTPVGISCTTVAVIGTALGSSKVTVSYTFEDLTMADDIVVATYKPLTVVHPVTQETVLALGTSREIMFSGGPRPWVGGASEHVHRIILDGDEQIIELVELVSKASDHLDVYMYRILCRELGEVDVTLHVTNLPTIKHCKRSESMATVRVRCAKPRYVSISSELKATDPSSCPMSINSDKLVTQSYRDIELLLTVKDDHGRVFDNVSSLYFDWKLSHPSLVSVQEKGTVLVENLQEDNIILPHKFYQLLKPKGVTGVLEVTVTITSYRTHVLTSQNIISEEPPFAITNERGFDVTPSIFATLNLILVNDTIVTPNRTTIFNHPLNKGQLQVTQGSGYYELVLSSEEVADVNYVETTRIVEVVPKTDGLLKLALVDLCLISKPAIAEIHVLGVRSIRVEVPERVERGQCVSAIVRLYDTTDALLPVPSPEFLDLRPVTESGIISVKLQQDKKAGVPMGEVRYIVTGLELGDTNLKFVSGHGKREVHSQQIPIQVFPPLKLFPRNMTLIVGSTYQISSRGGPQPDANVEYSIASSDIASISISGLVSPVKQGSSVITGKAVGLNKATGQRVVYTQDSVEVHVIPLRNIKISAPLMRMKTGTTMPIWAQGIPEILTPLIIGSLSPPLKFKWSVSSREVGVVHHIYDTFGLNLKEEDMVSVRFTAVNPGHTLIRLDVQVPPSITGELSEVEFHDILEIEVFEELELVHPSYSPSRHSPLIILAPNSEVQLKTNRDGLAKNVVYSVGGKILSTAQQSDESDKNVTKALTDPDQLLTVDMNGLLRSHSQLGRSVVMVLAEEDFGIKQIISISVEVKQIHYLMLTAQRKINIEEQILEVLPRGFEIEFAISYHDNSGSPFTATTSSIKLRTNRLDHVQLRSGEINTTLIANLNNPGATMVKVWDNLIPQHMADFIKLNVGEVIFPKEAKKLLQSETLTVGDIVCFSIPLSSIEGVHGTWETDNKNVLTLDPILGTGKVKEPGNVIVKHHLTSLFTFTELKAYHINSITFLEPSNNTLINTNLMSPFRVPLVLNNVKDTQKVGNLITRNGSCHVDHKVSSFPFTCELRFDGAVTDVSIQDVFTVHEDFNTQDGTYECVIRSSGLSTQKLSVVQNSLTLRVFTNNGISSKLLTIPFLPAVYVHSPHLTLSETRMEASVEVSGRPDILKQIRVIPLNSDFLKISGPESIDPNKVVYKVQLTEKYWQEADLTAPLSLFINSEATFQNMQVPVNVRLVGGAWTSSPCLVSKWGFPVGDMVYYYRHSFIVVASLVVIIFASIYVYINFFRSIIPVPSWYLQNPPRLAPLNCPAERTYQGPTGTSPLYGSSSRGSPPSFHMSRTTLEPVYGDPQLYCQTPSNLETIRSRRGR